jgi:hypothetical protein
MNAMVRRHFPSPRERGEGAERRRREAGEGASKFERKPLFPLTRSPSLRLAIDLSPQAGRGEGAAR